LIAFEGASAQLFDFRWLAQPAARSLFLLFTYSSRRRLFINRSFFEQLAKGSSARCSFPAVVWKGTNAEQQRRKRIASWL
jgi:hypothetical protein